MTVDIWANDSAGNTAHKTYRFTIDNTPPATMDDAPLGWRKADFVVTLTASDALSGVAYTSYRVDGGGWINGTSISITLEGNHSIEYYSVDKVGNKETSKLTYATLDKTAPVITIRGLENGIYYNVDVVANITVFDANLYATSITLDGAVYTSGTPISTEGTHILVISARDLAGNVAYSNITFVIDKTPPVVEIITPTNGSYIKGTVEINASLLNGIETISLRIDGSEVSTSLPYTWNTLSHPDGVHTIEVYVRDKAGNEGSDSIVVTVDNTPPSISILSPISGSYISSSDVTIVWNASDNIGISRFEVSQDELPVVITAETTKVLTNLADGLHRVEVKAFDLANNSASDFVSFTIDTIPPEIIVTGVANGSYYNMDVSANISISDANLKSTLILLDGAAYTSGTAISDEGIHILQVYAEDLAGNNASKKITFVIDKTLPEVNITTPVNGSYVGQFVEIAGVATDVNLNRISLSIDSVKVANALPYSWDTVSYSDGAHAIELKAFDKANNSASMSIAVIVDNTPPSMTIASPLAQSYSYIKNITIDFGVSDATSGIASFRAYLDGSEVASGQVIDLFNFTLGEHTLAIKASDNAGNNATKTVTFKVIDDVQPISSDNADEEWHNSDIVVRISANDEKSSVREIHYSVNEGQEVVVSGNVAQVTINYEHDNNTISYYAIDEWGNAESPRLVDGIKLDKTPPIVKLWLDPAKDEYFSDERLPVKYDAYDPKVQGTPSNNITVTFDIDGIPVEDPTDLSGWVGTHALTLTAVDKAGNKASSSVTFTVIVRAEINIDPDTLNIGSEGRWITAYIELPGQYDALSIKINTVTLNRTISAESDSRYDFVNNPVLADKDGDGLAEFVVKFDRSMVEEILEPSDEVTLSVGGVFSGGLFEGSDTIRVIGNGNNKTGGATLKLNKHVEQKNSGDSQVAVGIDLFATGSDVESVFVQEYIPEELARDTSSGAFTSSGLMWDVEKIEPGKKQRVEYTLTIPQITVPTTYMLRTVVEYQTSDDLKTIEEITYLTVDPDGKVRLDKGQGKSAVKEKGGGYRWGARGRRFDRGGSGGEGHGRGHGRGGRSEDPGRGNPPDGPPGNPNPGPPDAPPGNPNPGNPNNPNPPDNPGNPDNPPNNPGNPDPGQPENPGQPGNPSNPPDVPPGNPNPDNPSQPENPGNSDPIQPGNPEDPNPGQPDNPGSPGNPGNGNGGGNNGGGNNGGGNGNRGGQG